MKKYITIAALLAAGTACANAELVLTDFFPGTASATFENTLFNNLWQTGDIFKSDGTNFAPAYNYGLKPGILAEGAFYYDTGTGKAVGSGNEPTLSTIDGITSVSIATTGQGNTVAAIWKSITSSQLKNFSDLKFNVDVSDGADGSTLSVSVFYVANKGISAGTTSRIAYTSLSAGETWVSDDLLGSITGDGRILVALRSDSSTAWKNPSPKMSWTATVIPEPSAFGLLAGIGALALVGTRRRRK